MAAIFDPKFTITNVMATDLTRIERARGFLDAATLSENWIRAMGQRALVLEAYYSTHIEGTQLTLDQSERLLSGETVSNVSPDDALELLNYRRAFELVSDYLESGLPITEGLVREIHKRLVEGVRGSQAMPGEYRKVQNFVVNSETGKTVYTPPPFSDVPELMANMVSWLNDPGQVHPILVSGIAQFQLVHIHPFIDGNGRTSRLLSTLCLYRSGYDFKRLFTISEFYDRDRPAFYNAIQSVRQNSMDLTYWLEYFIKGLATQLTEVTDKGKSIIKSDIIASGYSLNQRQSSALRLLHEKQAIAIGDLEQLFPDINRRTLQRDLSDMEKQGLISKTGTARQTVYQLATDNIR